MKIKLVVTILCLVFLKIGISQTYSIKLSDSPAQAKGPIYSTNPWNFIPTTKSGIINVKAEFTSQNYTNITEDSESGLMFGVRNNDYTPDENADNKYFNPSDTYAVLGVVGAPESTYFSENIENLESGLVVGGRPNTQNGAILHFASVEGIAKDNIETTANTSYEMGTVKYTFNKPVTNPIIHISGLGGVADTYGPTPSENGRLRFSVEYELTSDYTMERLSGSTYLNGVDVFDIDNSGKKIINTLGDNGDPITGDNDGTSDISAASGSAIIYGKDITELVFKISMRAKTDGRWTQDDMYVGDAFAVSFTFGGVCTSPPNLSQQPEATQVGISTLDRNTENWLTNENDNKLGAYIALESSNKPLMITRNASPGLYAGDAASTTIQNIKNPVEGMIIWDDTKSCLSIYKVNQNGDGLWKCTSKGCNQ